jgi:DNA replication protein DnaC
MGEALKGIERIMTERQNHMKKGTGISLPSDYQCKEDPCCQDKGFFIRYQDLRTGQIIGEMDYFKIADPEIQVLWQPIYQKCPCEEKKQKREKMERILESSRLTPKFKKRTFDRFVWLDPQDFDEEDQPEVEQLVSDQRKAYQFVIDYCIHHEDHAEDGEGFALFGDYGTGKTHLLAASVIYLLERGIHAVYVSTTEVLQEIRKCFEPDESGKVARQVKPSEIIDLLKKADFLALDDVGKENQTVWVREVFYSIINYRYEHELPTAFTTNCTAEELKVHVGPATYRRLTEPAAGRAIKVKGPSYDMIKRRRKAG